MSSLVIESLSKRFDVMSHPAVDDVSLCVEKAELVALLGPSGCGKTTLLRMIAGFTAASTGRILIGERDVTQVPPHKRNTGMVFQNYALFPHMTVEENIAFGLQMRRVDKVAMQARVTEALRLVQLDGLASRYPRQLSGGQQQRVAIARALAIQPDVFLLDEPLSNLDAKLRQSVGLEVRALQQKLGLTTVFVTHDQNEALALADRLVVLNAGRVEQIGTAAELYSRPCSVFVASFLGQANLLPGTVKSPGLFTADAGFTVRCDTADFMPGRRSVVCLRPENVVVGVEATGLDNVLTGSVERVTYLGASTELAFRVSENAPVLLAQHQNREMLDDFRSVGATCTIGFKAAAARLLDET